MNNIAQTAQALLKNKGLFSIPVNIDKLANMLGITVRYEDLEDSLSGFLVVKNDVTTVVINKHHHSNRQRFTLAHEIGHLKCHINGKEESLFLEKKQVYNRDIISSTGTDLQEIEANQFAANLLMPEPFVREYLEDERKNEFINDFSGDSNSIEVLADTFQVSQAAFGHRLSSLYISKD